jgi:DNA mismatch repair protein MutS
MKFEMDIQTFNDLNILNETSTSSSIFDIFKHTRTIGGREKLREMMTSPSSDIELVNQRKDLIKYFASQQIKLDISNHELDLIEHYLNFNKSYLRNNVIDATAGFISNKLNPKSDNYIIKAGIINLIKLLKYLLKFAEEMSSDNLPVLMRRHCTGLISLIESDGLKEFVLLNEHKLSFYELSRWDMRLRNTEKKTLKILLGLVYEFDACETIALVSETRGYCFPEYVDGEDITLVYEGLYHPVILNPVTNDVSLTEENNIVFLTGSNMAGKSSLLKSLGLAVYLAHIGFPVPATRMVTSMFNGLITTINLPDDINEGLSHYYSEVKRVKHVAGTLAQNERLFVIFDELFRGTNVKDAFDASLLIIAELAAIRSSVFFISTHILELATPLKKFDNISFKYVDVIFENKKPIFTYKLKSGISTERLGMYIVQNEGIIELIKKAVENQG